MPGPPMAPVCRARMFRSQRPRLARARRSPLPGGEGQGPRPHYSCGLCTDGFSASEGLLQKDPKGLSPRYRRRGAEASACPRAQALASCASSGGGGAKARAGGGGDAVGLSAPLLRQRPKRRLDLGRSEAETVRGARAAVPRACLPVGPTAAPAGHLHGKQQGVPVVTGRLRVGAGARGR